MKNEYHSNKILLAFGDYEISILHIVRGQRLKLIKKYRKIISLFSTKNVPDESKNVNDSDESSHFDPLPRT